MRTAAIDDNRASCAVHAVAFIASAALLAFSGALVPPGPASLPFLMFASAMMLMYLASTLLHAWPASTWTPPLERLDRASIHLFIAASFGALASPVGTRSVPVIWSVATAFACATLMGWRERVWPYLVLGWFSFAALALGAAQHRRLTTGLALAGALAYTVGVRYFRAPVGVTLPHLKWHLLVVLGSSMHTLAALVVGRVRPQAKFQWLGSCRPPS